MGPSFDEGNALFDFVVQKGNGVKGLVDNGIKMVPERYIQPPNERIDKKIINSNDQLLVAIDLSKLDGAEHDEVVGAISMAAETLGFFQVVNHGVTLELLESLKAAAHNFFAQPPMKKAVYLKGVSPSPLVKYGTSFVPEKEMALEWKDYVSMMYTNDDEAHAQWPPECKDVALEYLKSSTKLVRKLLEILFGNLGVTLDEEKFESVTGLKMVNMNFYPSCPNPELTIGVGRHSDMGTLTVLLQDGIGGLYVKLEQSHVEDEWIEIPPIPGALVINVGDTMQILSNGRYKSAEHRVRTTSSESRVSIPLFATPKPSEKICPLPQLVESDGVAHYRQVLFGDYMQNFFGKAHEGKKSLDFARNDSV
ncbi:Scopoletin 8-hydroxylase [Datura stramonium]|uniref:Scopoletin 8-hydroxylase n=1 Tax=Datura stramonium TaxID=4076 RepID=A0ABS8SWW8_DATST|nr:Scopoletin 8-hydroxylase [Datura stramonium]